MNRLVRMIETIIEKQLGRAKMLGYTSLMKNQLLVVIHFVRDCDVFVCMQTGREKSLCNCLLPFSVFFNRSHTQNTPPEEKRTNAATNHMTELTVRILVQRKSGKTDHDLITSGLVVWLETLDRGTFTLKK